MAPTKQTVGKAKAGTKQTIRKATGEKAGKSTDGKAPRKKLAAKTTRKSSGRKASGKKDDTQRLVRDAVRGANIDKRDKPVIEGMLVDHVEDYRATLNAVAAHRKGTKNSKGDNALIYAIQSNRMGF